MCRKASPKLSFPFQIRPPAGHNTDPQTLKDWAMSFFNAIFHDEIQKKLSMNQYSGAQKKPQPLKWEEATKDTGNNGSSQEGARSQQVPSLQECAQKFAESLVSYHTDEDLSGKLGSLEFDKDLPVDLEFVTAAANIRAHIFDIPMKSKFDIKSIAGNIIPAIATTNAIAAGLQVLHAIKILQGAEIAKECRYVWICRRPNRLGHHLCATDLCGPNPSCFSCNRQTLCCHVDTKKMKLKDFFNNVLRSRLGFSQPSIDNDEELYMTDIREEDESEEEYQAKLSNLERTLSNLPGGGIHSGTELSVQDDTQDISLALLIEHFNEEDVDEEKLPERFWVDQGNQSTNASASSSDSRVGQKRPREAEDDGDVEVL
eukprot:gb/GECG01005871.1/.p1 GENE.gb/GECG01005871.1/~~gb/GECG01005871.1/.p1  ORF type:complete len:372 (+),score=50.72 gb/GECG01005871.1/:1-1116(+)